MFVIREAKPADAGSLRAIYLNLLRNTFTNFPAEAVDRYAADWTAELIETRIASGNYLLLGAYEAAWTATGLLFGAPPESGVGTVIWLGVAAEARGRGIGGELMRECFAAYRRRGCHKVKVYAENEAAKKFYLKLGMDAEGFHPRHWFGLDFWSLGIQI
ncbi:MAG TPA: N-acetyltransferase [Blastocatellia bacterium]|nr:N-acetyltransferase [Blastocatellia bacterium]